MIHRSGGRAAGSMQARIGIFFFVAVMLIFLIYLLDLEDRFPILQRLEREAAQTDERTAGETQTGAPGGERRGDGSGPDAASEPAASADGERGAASPAPPDAAETTPGSGESGGEGDAPADGAGDGSPMEDGVDPGRADVRQRVQALQAAMAGQREGLRRTRDQMSRQWNNLSEAVAAQRESLGDIRAEQERLSELPRELAEMDDRLRAMERRVYEHRDAIARLQRQVRRPDRLDMSDPVVLRPRNLYRNSPLRLFDGQVLIHLTGFSETEEIYHLEKGRRREVEPRLLRKNLQLQEAAGASEDGGGGRDSEPEYRRRKGADFEITLPLLDILVFKGVQVGDRRVFSYLQRDFFLEVLGTDEDTYARVAITRKLPE